MAMRFRSFLLAMLVGTTSVPYVLPDETDIQNCSITFDLPDDDKWATVLIGAISELARAEIWEVGSGGISVAEAIETAILIRQSVTFIGCLDDMQIKVGSYTGDGTATQAISGIGFLPVLCIIWMRDGGDTDRGIAFRATPDTNALSIGINEQVIEYVSNIDSLDADGFSVKNSGSSFNFDGNENGKSYTYVCFSA